MYLALLNQKQKELFCDIANIIIMADGIFREEERDLLESYGGELGFPVDLNSRNTDLDDVLNHLVASTTEKEKKIIVFESIGLAVIDSDYAKEEQEVIYKMMDKFEISRSFEGDCRSVLEEYISFQNRLNKLVLLS